LKKICAVAEKCAEKADVEEVEDKPCTRCGKSNQPECVCDHHLCFYFIYYYCDMIVMTLLE